MHRHCLNKLLNMLIINFLNYKKIINECNDGQCSLNVSWARLVPHILVPISPSCRHMVLTSDPFWVSLLCLVFPQSQIPVLTFSKWRLSGFKKTSYES